MQLQKQKRYNKKDVVAYVFLGEKCLDCLVLGSPGASIAPDYQQATTQIHAQTQTQLRAKKVRISLFDLKKKVQIIMKRMGADDKERFGSVSISLKKLAQGSGQTFMHWVTLFDTLDDDLYDGQLGEDDWEQPRVLLEYSVIGGKFTNIMNGFDRVKHDVDVHLGNQERGQMNKKMAQDEMEEYDEGKKAKEPEGDFTLTVECIETRRDKLRGAQQFRWRVAHNADNVTLSETEMLRIQQLEFEKDQEIQRIMELIEKFDIKRFKNKIQSQVNGTLDNYEMDQLDCRQKVQQYIDFLDKIIKDHQKNVGKESGDVFKQALESYATQLQELEHSDIRSLKKQIDDLQRMRDDLQRDLEEEETNEESMLGQREELWVEVDKRIINMRKQIDVLAIEVEEAKNDYRDVEKKDDEDEDEEEANDKETQGLGKGADGQGDEESAAGGGFNTFVRPLTKEEKKEIAKEMYKGCDDLYEKHIAAMDKMFRQSRLIQATREEVMKEMAHLQQLYRDHQLKNLYLMEHNDQLIDQVFEMKQHIEYLRKDIMATRKRQLNYLDEMYVIYKLRDKEIDYLKKTLLSSYKEKDFLEKRRDDAFNTLMELLAERRTLLGLVSDSADFIGMKFLTAKVDISQTRMEAQNIMEDSMKIWSTKLKARGLSKSDPAAKKDAEYKLQQMIRELEIKQKQLLKLLQGKDQLESRKKLISVKYEVQGRLEEAIEVLNLFARENKEDVKEIRLKMRETAMDLDNCGLKLREQEHLITKLRREYTETDTRLRAVNDLYKKYNPSNKKSEDLIIDEEIKEHRRLLKVKEDRKKEVINALKSESQSSRTAQQISELLLKEVKKARLNNDSIEHVFGCVYRFSNHKGLVQLAISKIGTLEVQKLQVNAQGKRSFETVTFAAFIANLK